MALSAAAIAKAAATVLSNEKLRKGVGWIIAAILSPLILIVVIILSLLSGTTQHNNAAVDLVFNGGAFPSTMAAEYVQQVQSMQSCLVTLDHAIDAVHSDMEAGTLDGEVIKSVFFSPMFGQQTLSISASEAAAFVQSFVRYETRTGTV